MSMWHLAWIVPVSAFTGFLIAALLTANRHDEDALECDLSVIRAQEKTGSD